MRSPVWLLLGLVASSAPAARAQSIPLDHFDGWQDWPVYEPGALPVLTPALMPLRIDFAGLFPGPNGFGRPPLDSLVMHMDLAESRFHGAPALWIQWLSEPPAGSTGAPALDALLVDRATFRLLLRLAASQPGDWAGRYEVVQPQDTQLVQVTVGEDGTTAVHRLDESNLFDFATYPFLFAFLDLHEGMAFRLAGYEYLQKQAEVLAVKVVGTTRIADAQHRLHDVWRVDVMPSHRATLITFYVTPEPPYFHGWDYRVVRDGTVAIQLRLRGWTPTAVR